jgi:hypothetical protein
MMNQHFEKGILSTPIEEEFSRLGFDYKTMLERGFYVGNDYALFMDTIKLNSNASQGFHHEVRFEFGVYCTDKRQPFAINHMVVKLKKFDGLSHEGQELGKNYYPAKTQFPTKDQICEEMQRVLQLGKENTSITQAQKIYSSMSDVKQAEPNSMKRRM